MIANIAIAAGALLAIAATTLILLSRRKTQPFSGSMSLSDVLVSEIRDNVDDFARFKGKLQPEIPAAPAQRGIGSARSAPIMIPSPPLRLQWQTRHNQGFAASQATASVA